MITVGYAYSFFFAVALFLGIFFTFTLYNSKPFVKYIAIVFLIIVIPFLQGISDIQKIYTEQICQEFQLKIVQQMKIGGF